MLHDSLTIARGRQVVSDDDDDDDDDVLYVIIKVVNSTLLFAVLNI